MDLGKVLPHDIEAEQAVLGSMLMDKDSVFAAIEKLKEEDFYREDNKSIYRAMVSLFERGEPIDTITVKSELELQGKLDKIGGTEYLLDLPERVPITANINYYVAIVEEKATLRNLIKCSSEIVELGYEQAEEVEYIVDQAEKKIFNVVQNRNQKGYIPLKDVLVDSFSEIEKLYNNKQAVTGIPTGFTDLDHITAGLHNSDLILIAARPAMGKSAFALNIATNAATKGGIPVLMFNLEMSKEQIGHRILCSEAMVELNKVKTGHITDDELIKLVAAVAPLSECEIYIDDTAGITVSEIRAKCRKLKLERNIGLVVIDYLQLIQASGKRSQNREQEISEISRSLKIMAKELDIPVIALSQLSRGPEQRADHRPMLADLRESGAIEQDADIVMFIYRDDYYNPESERKRVSEIILAKHRSGSTGTLELLYLGEYTKFVNMAKS